MEIEGGLLLCAHPGLSVTQETFQDRSLTLVGFLLDPDKPDATDADILQRVLRESSGLEALIAATENLGGRWALVATFGNKKYLFNDALGLRQAFYTDPECTGSLLVMSQPKIGADLLDLTIDIAAQEFIDSHDFRSNPEYKWPGASTPYSEIKHLLPNHYLDLGTGLCHRYWPNRRLEKIELNDAVNEFSSLLKGLIEAAASRFDLALAVTAGIDSRLVLAASKDVRDKISYFTVRQWMAPDDHADVAVSGKLLDQLGLQHSIIKASVTTTPEFSRVFKKNVFMAHDHYGSDAEAILKYFSRKKVAVTGSGAEMGKCCYDLLGLDHGDITAEQLLTVLHEMGTHKFSIQHIQQWLQGLGDTHNVNLFDLLFWDLSHGNWLPMTQLEFDIAWKDIFTPYNCRTILTIMLSVDEKYRKEPDPKLFLETIRNLWPEVLCEPINPHKETEEVGIRQRIKNLIKSLSFFGVMRG